MIDEKDAVKIINNKFPELKISTMGRIKRGWLFSFENSEGKKLRISPVLVLENNGETEIFFPPKHREEMKDYVKVEFGE